MTLTVIISIHALRGEGDGIRYIDGGKLKEFQSTPSVGRATDIMCPQNLQALLFQSTPSVGRATDESRGESVARMMISIHALRGEGDVILRPGYHAPAISIHALRGEGDMRAE